MTSQIIVTDLQVLTENVHTIGTSLPADTRLEVAGGA